MDVSKWLGQLQQSNYRNDGCQKRTGDYIQGDKSIESLIFNFRHSSRGLWNLIGGLVARLMRNPRNNLMSHNEATNHNWLARLRIGSVGERHNGINLWNRGTVPESISAYWLF
jgi:hypothetical protein